MMCQRRPAISGTAVVLVLIFLLVVAVVYVAYLQSLAPKASISISMGKTCSPLHFDVTSQDSRILHGWSVTLQVSPTDSHISISPVSASVISLAPQGSYGGNFSISFNNAPPGVYQFKANLVNESQTIASSNTLQCQVK